MPQTSTAQAAAIVANQLQQDENQLAQTRLLDLPVMGKGTTVWGPAPDNAELMIDYPASWTGLAGRYEDGKTSYWFLGRCEATQEREFYCLGAAQSVSELIERAKAAVARGIEYWSSATGQSIA